MTEQSGFEKMGSAKASFFDAVAHVKELGITLEDVGPGAATLKLDYQDRLVGNLETGVLAGGVVTTLLDTAAGVSVIAALGNFQPLATLGLRIDYLTPATPQRAVLARSHCYRITRWIAFVRGVAYHDNIDDPIANFTATFMATGDRPFARPQGA
ncbi:MAG: PaaI family thioesterase [Sphingomonadales bacterium]